jgi:choline kinase
MLKIINGDIIKMKIYIVNYSKNIERRKKLENDSALSGKDITWVTEWDREELFVKWVHWYSKTDQIINHISLFLKHVWCLNDMVKNDIKECIILEDDVVFEENWLEKFNNIQKQNLQFIKLGSIFQDLIYNPQKIYSIGNPGGTEALWVTQGFAKTMLKNLEFQQTIDIFYGGVLNLIQQPLACIPVCSQTSVYESTSSLGNNECKINWIEYIKNFSQYKKYDFNELLVKFEKFKIKKQIFEDDYNKRFNCNITLNDFNFMKKNYI